MDEAWTFWPITEVRSFTGPLTMEIDQTLFDQFTEAQQKYNELKDQMEQLYRIQEGYIPYQDTIIPEHTLLVKPGEPV